LINVLCTLLTTLVAIAMKLFPDAMADVSSNSTLVNVTSTNSTASTSALTSTVIAWLGNLDISAIPIGLIAGVVLTCVAGANSWNG
jgi:hypothetical protein